MTFKDSKKAFEQAIREGRLTAERLDDRLFRLPNYAGDYMYMGTDDSGRDLFKSIETRAYDV